MTTDEHPCRHCGMSLEDCTVGGDIGWLCCERCATDSRSHGDLAEAARRDAEENPIRCECGRRTMTPQRERWRYVGRIGSRHWWERVDPPPRYPFIEFAAHLKHAEMWPPRASDQVRD